LDGQAFLRGIPVVASIDSIQVVYDIPGYLPLVARVQAGSMPIDLAIARDTETSVSGVVLSTDGEPLTAVVTVPLYGVSAATTVDGRFTIRVPVPHGSLVLVTATSNGRIVHSDYHALIANQPLSLQADVTAAAPQ
jgi:hypothetical protein